MATKRSKAQGELVSVRSAKHVELIRREAAVRQQAETDGVDPYRAIAADRAERWAKHPLIVGATPLMKQWASQMTAQFDSDTVRIWHTRLPWLTALAVARYGEAEDYWPPAFSDGDVLRAAQWQLGAWVPEGVKFAAGGASLASGRLSLRRMGGRPS